MTFKSEVGSFASTALSGLTEGLKKSIWFKFSKSDKYVLKCSNST